MNFKKFLTNVALKYAQKNMETIMDDPVLKTEFKKGSFGLYNRDLISSLRESLREKESKLRQALNKAEDDEYFLREKFVELRLKIVDLEYNLKISKEEIHELKNNKNIHSSPFSISFNSTGEVKSMLNLTHPDKHNNSQASHAWSVKLNNILSNLRGRP